MKLLMLKYLMYRFCIFVPINFLGKILKLLLNLSKNFLFADRFENIIA